MSDPTPLNGGEPVQFDCHVSHGMCSGINFRRNLGVPQGGYRVAVARRALPVSPQGQHPEAWAYPLRRASPSRCCGLAGCGLLLWRPGAESIHQVHAGEKMPLRYAPK